MVEEQAETNHSGEEQIVEDVGEEEEEDAEEPQEESSGPEQDPEQDKIKPVIYIGLLLTSLFALGNIGLISLVSFSLLDNFPISRCI